MDPVRSLRVGSYYTFDQISLEPLTISEHFLNKIYLYLQNLSFKHEEKGLELDPVN